MNVVKNEMVDLSENIYNNSVEEQCYHFNKLSAKNFSYF